MFYKIRTLLIYTLVFLIASCSSEKFLHDDEEILSNVQITTNHKKTDLSTYQSYIRQHTNSKWFNLVKVPLGIYCIAGTDTTNHMNRFWKRIGEAPVIYDAHKTDISQRNLMLSLRNKGYLHASVDTIVRHTDHHKVNVEYSLFPGTLYKISNINYDIDNNNIAQIIEINNNKSLLKHNMGCDATILDQERDRIVTLLHNEGYYKVLKNFMTYELDTCNGPRHIALKLNFKGRSYSKDTTNIYTRYTIRNITINVMDNEADTTAQTSNTIFYKGITINYFGSKKIRPSVIYSQLRLFPGQYYNEDNIDNTYRNFNNLQIVRYAVVKVNEDITRQPYLDCNINIKTDKTNAISAEIEGTNTSGDLGMAATVTYTNRNLFRGSEVWTTKLKGAYEAITGLEGYNNQDFIELSIENRLSFPRIIAPFIRTSRMRGSSELTFQYDMQERPEFHRRVVTGLWGYKWSNKSQKVQHKLDAININYVFMPWISDTFRKNYLDNTSSRLALVRHSYDNLFIVNAAYGYVYNSAGLNSNTLAKNNAYQIRFNIETAGNLLYLASNLLNGQKDSEGNYSFAKVAYAQYAKFDIDFVKNFMINTRNTFAVHFAGGIVAPYGNSDIVPYEKRYFAGGANSIRGWSVRQLGPGTYHGKDGNIDYINQTGNIKLLANVELRTMLFWKFQGALFIDAGNIWTIRNYDAQPGGVFKPGKFYEQIAASYGLGIRLNLDYFIIRIDCGIRAIDPTLTGKEHYPLLKPTIHKCTTHFAVGLPF